MSPVCSVASSRGRDVRFRLQADDDDDVDGDHVSRDGVHRLPSGGSSCSSGRSRQRRSPSTEAGAATLSADVRRSSTKSRGRSSVRSKTGSGNQPASTSGHRSSSAAASTLDAGGLYAVEYLYGLYDVKYLYGL